MGAASSREGWLRLHGGDGEEEILLNTQISHRFTQYLVILNTIKLLETQEGVNTNRVVFQGILTCFSTHAFICVAHVRDKLYLVVKVMNHAVWCSKMGETID